MDELELSPCIHYKIVLCDSCKSVLSSHGKTSPGWKNAGGNATNFSWGSCPARGQLRRQCPHVRGHEAALGDGLLRGDKSGAATPGADLP